MKKRYDTNSIRYLNIGRYIQWHQPLSKRIRVPEVAQTTRIKTVEEWEQVKDALGKAVRQKLGNGDEVELG